jgi:hypothetical protein
METTTKSKITGKTGKKSSKPTEEQIRDKAREIYHERLKRGEYGTANDDWHQAEKLLSKQDR